MPLQIVQRLLQTDASRSLQAHVQALTRIGVSLKTNLCVSINLLGERFDFVFELLETFLRVRAEQAIVERNRRFVDREAQLSAQRRLFFELAAVFQSRAKYRAQSFLIRTVKLALLTKEQPAPIPDFIDTQMRILGDQNNARPSMHMTVVGDIVINAIGGLNPAVKDIDKFRQCNSIGRRDEKLDVEFL